MKSLSLKPKLYLTATYLAGMGIFAFHLRQMDLGEPWLIIALCVLASLSLILRVEGSTRNSHYSFNFLVYGFTFAVLGAPETILVIVVSNIVEWIWNKQHWYVQLFNTSCYIISIEGAGFAYMLISSSLSHDTWQTALGIFAAMAVFNALNHLMIGFALMFARGESFKQSGMFEFFPLMLDLALLTFGASLSFVWSDNPYALALFIIPVYLMYSTLRVPALERKTEIDSKTGLFNHEYFKKQLNNELVRANRFDRPMSVILADLDLLRNVNNTYGHLAGDQVLIGIAHAMKKSVRDYDVVCRFGGEEFAILLPETTLNQAFGRAEVIRKTVEAMEFTVPTSITPIRATLSLGIAHRENFSQTQDEIIHNADLALYHSKLSGRNQSFAYHNESYMDFREVGKLQLAPAPPLIVQAPLDETRPERPSTPSASTQEVKTMPLEMKTASLQAEAPRQESTTSEKPAPGFKHAVRFFIGGLGILSVIALAIVIKWAPFNFDPQTFDWLGLFAICLLIILSEGFSVDLYVRQTSVSTSAIPMLVAYLLFGTTGIVLACLVLAISLVIKFRSPFSRFIFNLSNHLLAGTLVVGLLAATGRDFLVLPVIYQIGLSLLAAFILYFVTTWMIAFGMGLNLNQSAYQLWKEQFSWLAPYYLGIGLITYALIFGYRYDHVTGLLLMIIPMVLLRVSQKQYIDRTREVVAELREKNQILKKNSEEISELNEGLLVMLSEIIDLRDPYVLGHSKQVSKYATEIATLLGLNEKQIDLIRKAGLLHDIGKLGISMEILTKPSKLTTEEYETIKTHAALGGEIIKSSPSLRPLVSIIRHHHEYFNGEGYPDKLAGNQISIESRIISVSDAIEAMISDRPYRRAIKRNKIMEELKRCSGTQFDPLVVDAALQVLGRHEEAEQSLVTNPSQQPMIEFNQSVQRVS